MQERGEVNDLLQGVAKQLRRGEHRPVHSLLHIRNSRIPIVKAQLMAPCRTPAVHGSPKSTLELTIKHT
jgi:hypothetical protein